VQVASRVVKKAFGATKTFSNFNGNLFSIKRMFYDLKVTLSKLVKEK